MHNRQETVRQKNLSKFGEHAELWVKAKLESLGLYVEHIGSSYQYDLLIEGKVRAEVKAAVKTKGNRGIRWQFSFGRHNGINDEEIVFLVCCDGDLDSPVGVFVIPGCDVEPKRKKIDITSDPNAYTGKWARYLGRWDVALDIAKGNGGGKLYRKIAKEEIPF